ncbi:putative Ig domain-containing protein [Adhaeribacter swui]|uniref:Putative Ig domain-containing protein n=1 Tax=Adhaeribacter swui TaxID=2086471 RepID=A0A7G7GA83_9BACT|nr:malectin domain-containing carbohydrate-binding protein [Adhaeribacter swui]QNF34067.1 putative Ig domain-containing protein [Adhaeribacter swui]
MYASEAIADEVALPFTLTFDGTEGGLTDKTGVAGTGFTMVDPYSGTRSTADGTPSDPNQPSYDPAKLTVVNGKLSIVSNKGIGFLTNNNQINALGTSVAGNGKIIVETTLINPLNGTQSEQAGLWFGLNDKTFIKLVATGNKVEMRKEVNDISSTVSNTTSNPTGELSNPDQRITGTISNLNTQTVRLRMIVDLISNRLEGFYSTDGITYLNVGSRYYTTYPNNPMAINIADMGLAGKTVYAGIYASYRNSNSALSTTYNGPTFTFDDFSIKRQEFPVVTAPYRINAGGVQRIVGGKVFNADNTYALTEGEASNVVNYTLTGVDVPEIYYERRFGTAVSYYMPIANGKYTVNLQMLENFHTAANSRLFDIALENKTVADDLDLFVAGGNKNKVVVTRSYEVEVKDQVLNLDFVASKDKAIVNAIEILPIAVNTPPAFASTSYSFNKDENASIGTEIGSVSATDAENNAITYSIIAGNEAGKFTINSGSGVITLAAALDYAVTPTYTLTVQATDNGSPVQSAITQVTISVNDVVPANNAPVVANAISSKTGTIGSAFVFEVPTNTFSDADNDALTLSATLADGSALPTWLSFNGNAFSGTPVSAADYAIKVTATDGKASVSTDFNLTVEAATPANQAPVFSSTNYSFSKERATPVNTVIGSVKATDAVDQTIAYSIIAGNEAAKFAIDAVSGELTLTASLLDVSTSSYTLTIQATDNGTPALSATTQVTITINGEVPANAAPVVANLIGNKTATVGSAFFLEVPANTFTDTDNDVLTLSATLADGSALPSWLNFNGSAFSGTPENAATYTVKVTANDGQATASTQFNIAVEVVTPVNQVPVFASSNYSFSKDENAIIGAVIGSVSATDTENHTITYSIIAGNEAGKFAINPASGVITLAATLDHALTPAYTLTVKATDNGNPVQSATALVNITVIDVVPANVAPVVANAISAKKATVGAGFNFAVPANTFSDADNDALTLSATLADGSALPTWLSFNGNAFSGTPVSAADYAIKVTANDGKASVSTEFNLTIEAAPAVGCPPNSTLPCNQVAVSLPFNITFNGTEGGLLDKDGKGTGFTIADAYTGTRVTTDGVASSDIRGYEPSKLTVSNGKLAIVSNRGISIVSNNNQINGLGVEFNASNGRFVIEATIVNPFRGSNDEQAGLWYGLNDKTFVRLAINNNRVVLRKELNDLSPIASDLTDPSRRNTSAISNLDKQTVRLRLVVDPTANTVEGYYSVNGTTYINVGEGYPVTSLSIEGMGLTGNKVYAGIFGTYRNGTTPVTYNFDSFSIAPQTTPTNQAPVVAAVIGNKTITTGTLFNFEVPANTFTDADNNPLTLSASLSNGSALPSWLTFNTATKIFSGTPTSAAIYPIKVTATDGQASVSTEFTLTVQAANLAPVVVSAPENQVLTAGQVFSFVTGSFSDPNAGDVLTYSAALANGNSLPSWLQFDANTQTFSGTAPTTATSVAVRLTATDKALAATSASFTITVEAAPIVVPCSPLSTLPCEQINVPLPFVLNFDGSEGGLTDKSGIQTGFTMVDAPSGTRLTVDGIASSAVTGYEPSRLTIANGKLTVATNKGIGFLTSNNQLNALGAGVLANGKLTLETTVINPYNGTLSEQAGLWFGLDDKTFVKLAVSGNKIEMRQELNDISSTDAANNGLNNPDQRILLNAITGLNTQTVRLRLVVDLVVNKLEGFYSTDGVTYLNVGARYATPALDITKLALASKMAYAGIYATHRNANASVNYTFENFSLTKDNTAGKVLAFTPNALDFTAIQGQSVASKMTVLAASEGAPAVTFSSTPASWLTLPTASLGNVAFGATNFSSTLAPGIYEATITASAEGYQSATLLINLTVNSPVVAQEIKVNFQDPATVTPTGWVKDYGQPFGLRTGANQGTNLEYGWRKRSDGTLLDLSVGGTTPGNGRKRTTPADILQATLMHMQADDITGTTFNGTPIEGYWEIKVPNGKYDVTVSAGDSDPGTVPESHTLNVEGVNAFSNFVPTGTAGTATRFKSAKVRVTVNDGFLTINADGGINTKINSALITPIDVAPYLIWSASDHSLVIERGTSETNKTFSLDLGNSADLDNLPISLTAAYGAGASNWLSFDATHNSSEPNVTFDYTAAKSLPVGTYTATITATTTGYTPASTLIQITVLTPGSNQPYVISSTPANGATNVSVNTSSIAANSLYVPEVSGFKGGVDNSTLTVNTVKLLKVSGTTTSEIQGVVQGTGGGDAISFSPAFALEPNTKYRFVITNQVKSHSGAAFLPYEANFTTGATTTGTPNPVAAEFAPKQVIPGTVGKKYTCLTFGPDGKFYALRLDGVIERFIVDRETGMLSGAVEIKTLTNKYGLRSSVGLTFAPNATATNLIAYVSHCSAGLTNAPEFDGNISRLSGADLGSEELILTKLPRSKADHLVNSITFGPDGALYFNQGSNSSMGSYDGTWQRDESLLSASVLRLDLNKLAGMTLPLDVRTTANQNLINNAPANNIRFSDGTYNPYATNSPLTIYASGIRNAVDMVWHTNGQLYVPANGSAAGGNSPASVPGTRRPDGTLYSGPVVPATTSIKVQNDWLFRINPLKPVGYFGHPNPLRGQYVANRGYLDNPKYAPTQGPDANYRGAAYNFELNKSPNGVIEYKSNAFGGALKGRILVCRFSGGSDIIVLEPGSMAKDPAVNSADSDDKIYDIIGAQTGSGTDGITGLSGFTNPLDIIEDVETGNLYVIEYNWNNISGKTAQIVLLKAKAPSAQVGIAAVSPSEIVDNDVVGGGAGKNHTITIANTGNSNLTVTGITLDGVDKGQFQLIGAPTPSVTSPITIARGSAITFNVAFNATSTGVKSASLLVNSTNNSVKEVKLSGLGTSGLSGTNEPSLQAVLDVHGINVNVGDDNKSTNIIHSTNFKAPLLGEEVSIQAFQRAVDGPVTIEPLSVFGPQDAGGIVTALGWYTSGNANDKNELFTVANDNYQTVDVKTTGSLSFDPGIASFGFYSRWPYFTNRHLYSEDALNTFTGAVPHHVRVYPLKDSDGSVIENAYIVATEEHTSGYDYQDIVVIVRNVKPFGQAVAKELSFSSQSLAFTTTSGSTTTPQTVTLSANTGNPVLTITKSANSNWLTLPTAALGSLTFGINEAGLNPGTYNATVTVSADGYTSAILPVTLTVNSSVAGAMIVVSNEELVFDALKNTTVTKRLTVTNTGTSTLNLGSVAVGGTNADKFSVQAITLEGEPTGTTLAPEETKTYQIAFTPGNLSVVSTFEAALTINSNAVNSPALKVGLYAMSLNGYEGNNEPPLQTVVNTLGYNINVGWTNLAGGIQTTMKGEEVPVQLFEKSGNGPVTITPVARYSPNQELPFGYYTKNNNAPVRSTVGTLSGVFGQHNALFPQIVAGSDQFNPESAAFGIYVVGLENRISYTEDQLNAGGPALHAVRAYPLKNRAGEMVPNSYLICFEDASNGDYQDYMFVLKNVVAAGTRKSLAFDVATLNFNAPVNGSVAAKTVTLTAKNGTPSGVSLSKSANSNWLVLPTAATGNLAFGINTTGLTAGVYTSTVTATATGFDNAVISVNLRIGDVSANAIKVNFQLATSATPAGYLADAGLPYNDTRGYGWINPTTKEPKDHTASMRERTSANADTRLKTLALMQGTASGQTPGTWEVKVANGQYNVTVGAGDNDFYDSNHRINVEGVTAISNFVPTAQVPHQIATTTVNVTDGKLTIDATGGTNTKITFVIVDPATADGDFLPPVASVQLKGTLQSTGVYRNQVIATINASDAGGSNLAQVLYSLNNQPYTEYYAPILVNTAGTYTLRAKAIDGNKNETITNLVSFTIVQPELSNTNMVVENLDKFPANDRLVASLIQTPWRRANDDGTFTPYNRNHDVVRMRISNKGTGALTINGLTLSNPTGWKVTKVNNVDYDATATAPITVNAGSSVEVSVQFIAQFTSGRIRILNDTLQIASNDDLTPKKKVVLHGMWQARGEGGNEPHAQEIIQAFGFKSKVGFNTNDGTNTGNSLVLNSDEILSSFFTRADASKPVYVVQMGAYHGCCAATETFQYYVKGSTSNATVFTHHPLDGQSLLPLRNGTAGTLAEGTFNPTGSFGFKISGSYSDRTRNSEGKLGMRVWKAVDANGNVIPNAYIIGHDYIGNPDVTNYDYQDNVYYVSNIKPEAGSLNYSELASTPSAVDFGSRQIGVAATRTIELKNLGQIYTNGTTDPAITIKSLEIVGANLNEFTVATPSATTIAPQATASVTVGFRSNSQGIKNAALLVHYNNGLSPLRVPLYGIADDNCNVITAVKRIKGGSDANVTINGKVWEADRTYRQGSVQLDRPAVTPIAGTDEDVLYQTYLSAAADLAETRYSVPVANGNYMVRMHFVENFFTTEGSRVFSINLENQNRQSNFDIFREAGYKAALVKDFTVNVTDGKLDVKFNPTVNRVALAGMEIFAASANPNAVTLTQQTVLGAECGLANGSITFGVTNSTAGSYLYKMGPNGTYQTSPVFNNLTAGSFTFFVKENVTGGCETAKVFTIPERNTLAFNVTAPVMTCAATSGTASVSNVTGGTGNYTITWNTSPVQTGATATNLQPGVYTVTVLDASGCSKTQEVTVTREQNCTVANGIRINAGGAAYAASGNRQFIADQYFGGTAGTSSLASGDILNTTDDEMYRTERSSATFNYSIPVTNGTYNVVLHFAEIWFTGATGRGAAGTGRRMFNVDVEGSRKLTNYDITAKAGGAMRAIQETIPVTVTDGTLNINFTSGTANLPKVSAIEVLPQTPTNVAPVLTAIGNKTVNVNQALTFTATATDANANQTKAFSLIGQPTGASINASTGVFTWTPTTAGTYTFTVRVTDNGSPVMFAEERITVTVNNVVAANAIRINAGGAAYAASGNRQFIADQYFGGTAGTSSLASGDILNTTDDEMYRTERSSATFNYSIPVTNGTYNVVLHFAEIWFTGATGRGAAGTGRRMFNVDVEGSRKLTNYDITAKAGGAMRAIQETIPVTVTDGTLNINFTSGTANLPKVSAIEVLPQTPTNVAPVLTAIGNKTVNVNQALTFTATATDANANQTKAFSLIGQPTGASINASTGVFTWTPTTAGTYTFTVRVTDNGSPVMFAEERITVTVNNVVAANAIRINAGGAAYAASGNRQFIADQYFGGTNRTYSIASGDVLNTTDDEMYRTERSSATFNYSIPVTNGTYNVVLHFAEVYHTAAGRRMFNVDVEGGRKLTNYDIYAKAGGNMRAIQETIPVSVTDGILNINFTSGTADMPKVSAIEVLTQTGARIGSAVAGYIGENAELTTSVLTAYPNPNPGDEVTITGNNFMADENVTIVLYDAQGSVIQTKAAVTNAQGNLSTNLVFTKRLSSGVYMLMATSRTNKVSTRLVVR